MEEGSAERSLIRNLQKEQERERRRIRDRQRRQSMSVEEREKHLARRRRNYQLRRQRAENARFHPTTTTDFISFSNVDVTTSTAQCNNNSVGLEIPSHKLAKLSGRFRLNHLKHLARSRGDPVDIPDHHTVAADLIIKGNETANSNCVSPKGLRLNRVKRLARSLNSDLDKATSENHQSRMEVEQNLPSGEVQVQLLSMKGNLSKLDQPSNVGCGNQ